MPEGQGLSDAVMGKGQNTIAGAGFGALGINRSGKGKTLLELTGREAMPMGGSAFGNMDVHQRYIRNLLESLIEILS
jgi:hypothetical protein